MIASAARVEFTMKITIEVEDNSDFIARMFNVIKKRRFHFVQNGVLLPCNKIRVFWDLLNIRTSWTTGCKLGRIIVNRSQEIWHLTSPSVRFEVIISFVRSFVRISVASY